MALLWKQIRVLTAKTLRITLVRHWIATPLRALLLPILIVLFLSFIKNFISKDSLYGFGPSRLIRPLSDVLDLASEGRNRVIFVSSFSGGEIDRVIEEVSAPLRDSGVEVQTLEREEQLRTACLSSIQGTSKCIGAAVFHGSPTEGVNKTWNYTMRADGTFGTEFFADSDHNDVQVYTIPLQHAIDFAIARNTSEANQTALGVLIHEYPFTTKTEQERKDDNRERFMNMIKDVLAAPFYLSIACVIYQMTGFIATEQEIGMSRLLDTMMPNRKRWQTQAARTVSNHLAFDILYLPGWIITGAIMGAMSFPATTIIIPIVFHILAGLSTTSMSLFAAAFFRKAQLSGIIAIIAGLGLAIVAQIVKSGTAVIIILSLLFPPMNYIYFLVTMTRWESEDRATNLFKSAPIGDFSVPAIVFWLFTLIHIFVYHFAGVMVERWLYGTASSSRQTVVSQSPVAVSLNGFAKEYAPEFFDKVLSWWNKRSATPFRAVDNLNLEAFRGEIMVLLGANGSGKSTTLDAISGQHSISSGNITINYQDPLEGFGYCPQRNILWDDLTVREHVYIFDRIKSHGKPATASEISSLIELCDLSKKKKGLSASLSGGQKRKLQLTMMFAGGSTVCCVDEVSSGVDPLSRRKLWDILVAERGRRSIILTTHFLDEADLLADRVAILSKGQLKALGSTVELKHELGSGYSVRVHQGPGSTRMTRVYRQLAHKQDGHGITYFPGTSTEASALMESLEHDGITDYEVNGPTLEDVFFKVEDNPITGQTNLASNVSQGPITEYKKEDPDVLATLGKSNPVGLLKQMRALIAKRYTIFRRNPAPYLALLAVALIAAGCSTLFLKKADRGYCNPEETMSTDNSNQNPVEYKLVAGPENQLTAAMLERIAAAPPGSVSVVDTLDDFNAAVERRFGELQPGGFFLGPEPTMAWRGDGPPVLAHITQNLLNNVLFNITINSGFEVLDVPFVSDLTHYLLFIIYFGLSMSVYPAFVALYPTMERLRGIRSMHYSNGVRQLPLWLAYLVFDFVFIMIISFVSIIIFGASVDLWYSIGYLLLVFLLYGVAATLYAYVMSIYSSSQLASFAVTAGTQVAGFLIYFVVFVITYTNGGTSGQAVTVNIAYFTLGLISPVVSLSRALHVSVNIFGVSCDDKKLASYPGAIDLYGGPILYLILQSFVLFAWVIWKESASSLRRGSRKEKQEDIELSTPIAVQAGVPSLGEGLSVLRLRKKFKKFVAVDDVSFGIPRGECFALVGPNGAGKSTSISMIRGEIQPSGRNSQILIDGVSASMRGGNARSRLGVCPQIDPLDHMTVTEHLHFYAQIRGLKNLSASVQAVIDAVGLQPFSTRIASQLSGGNKRKLSLGIALVGNPSVLLLDEPSSGMDAVSKRVMWRTLSAITPGRSLLLTTHSMEEADALASRAGIIAGRMLAQGTVSELQASYGNAHFIQLVHKDAPLTSGADMERTEQWILREFRDATFDGLNSHGQVRFEVPLKKSGGERSLADIFTMLESAKVLLGVEHYTVATATLDQIFSNVMNRYHVEEER